MNLMFEITSENIFVSDGESGTTDPPSYGKSEKKLKWYFWTPVEI